jgi:hypothetical protein
MTSQNEAEQVNERAAEFNRYSIRLWVVLSLILSLGTIFILSKKQLVDHRWVYAAALILPISCTLYFRKRIVLFGPFVYVAALIAMLIVAVFFGM